MKEIDTEKFVRLLTQHERALYRYVVSLLPTSTDADDVMQNTAAVLWKKFSAFDPERPFLPWAMQFAYFETLKHRRAKGRSRLIFSDELVEKLAEEYPNEQTVFEARRQALDACLERLGSYEQKLLFRRYSSGDTIGQLAEEENRPAHKLYYILEKTRAKLLECIDLRMRKEGWDASA